MSEKKKLEEKNVLVVREGHGANCSSIGSVIDMLFVAQVTAGALIAAVAASLNAETVTETESESATETGTGAESESESEK